MPRIPQGGAACTLALVLLLTGAAREVRGQTAVVLDTFNAGSATGSITAGTSWAAPGAVVQNTGSITVAAGDDNGWGASGLAVNGTGLAYVRITGQRDLNNAAPSLFIQFEDRNLAVIHFVSVSMSAFAPGSLGHVQIPISFPAGFDASQITGWSIGGGAPLGGQTTLRMTLDNLTLVPSLSLAGGGTTTTAGDQVYTGAQTLTAAAVLNTTGSSGNAVTFSSTIDGSQSLTINTPGAMTFAGAVGNITPLAGLTTDAGGTTAINGGMVITTGAQTYNDTVSLGADTAVRSTSDGVIQFFQPLVGNNHSLALESSAAMSLNAASQLTSLTKAGAGTLTMSGTSTYTGATIVNGGTLKLTGLATSSAFTINSGATLSGGGSLGALSVASGGTLSPGASTGTLSAGNTTWAGGAAYTWEVNNATGTSGTGSGWDLLAISGSLTLNATSGNPFTVRLNSLNGSTAGLADNFSPSANYSFTFVTTTLGVTNFPGGAFAFDPAGFSNPFSGTWSVGQSGNDLVLNYTASAIPEPSTYAAIAGACVFGLAVWSRRRRGKHR